MEEQIKIFLNISSGYGYGYGYGSGYGYGNGDGSGSKIQKYEGEDVFYIDEVPTIIRSIKGDYAKGYTINSDYSKTPCWVARSADGRLFAHGDNLHDAVNALNEKIAETMTEEERIELFCKTFKKSEKYKGTVFFDWHNRLTGSCLFGRNQFVKDKGLDLEASYTVNEFIEIVENAFGVSIIRKLKSAWDKIN